MKTALITTTINIPTVLELYRAHGPDVRFFVALEYNSSDIIQNYVSDLQNAQYILGGGYRCSELIGWKTIARRNIALLEALKWGADLIVSIDDDNIPIGGTYFTDFQLTLNMSDEPWDKFAGIEATAKSGWFDVGTLLDPVAPHRGFPHVKRADPVFSHVVGAHVGVAAGVCLGDPDIAATHRIASAPIVHRTSQLLESGIVVDPRKTLTVFNSQNTAIIRELAPAFFMLPQFRRFDDILGSLVVQRIMRDRGYVVHFGRPMVFQQRNDHDLLKDLEAELWGSQHILKFSEWLNGFAFTGKEAVTDCLRIIFTNCPPWMPAGVQELVLAWCEDVESVL